jgi:predicted regulator of Ras-like GTPase activity (Roadblock/LC7/MglB family)
VNAEPLAPERAAAHLCELAADVRAAVLIDANGAPAGGSGEDRDRARALGALAVELLAAVDDAVRDGRPEQVEAHTERGSVFLVRWAGWTLVAVARRSALPSLMFFDLRATLERLEPV